MTTLAVPSRANRHSMPLVREARQLGRAGWTPHQIAGIFRKRGVDPCPPPNTIRYWLRGGLDMEKQRELDRRHKARVRAERSGGRIVSRAATPEFKVARIRGLRELGVSYAAIAKVMTFDFGERITEKQVRDAAVTGTYPRRLLQGQA